MKYVILSDAPPDYSARAEAALVASGRAGLVPVFATKTLTVYSVPNPQPILTGPGLPQLESLTEAQMDLVVTQAGRYRIAVRWSPYWQASAGCLSEGKDGMIRLTTWSAHIRSARLPGERRAGARRADGDHAALQGAVTIG